MLVQTFCTTTSSHAVGKIILEDNYYHSHCKVYPLRLIGPFSCSGKRSISFLPPWTLTLRVFIPVCIFFPLIETPCCAKWEGDCRDQRELHPDEEHVLCDLQAWVPAGGSEADLREHQGLQEPKEVDERPWSRWWGNCQWFYHYCRLNIWTS